MIATRDEPNKKHELRDLVDDAVKGRIDANRRFVDDALKKIQDQNHQYFLEKLGSEIRQMEIDQKGAGNLQGAMHHRVMAYVYKSILEKCF
jgi:polyhydroxyalkanoate synthesis regulator phasin